MAKFLFEPFTEENGVAEIPSTEDIGGKSYGLYWLQAHGFSVPQTWVLGTPFFSQAMDLIGMQSSVDSMWETLDLLKDADWATVQKAFLKLDPQRRKMVESLRSMPIFDRIAATLSDIPLLTGQWAVRSSATTEDNPKYSFAGQFSSFLSVPRANLWDAVRQVWASTFNSNALIYCLQKGAPTLLMAVILQAMYPVSLEDRSGVVFSHSPVPNMSGAVIQATFGMGETVVQGYGGDLYNVKNNKVSVQSMPAENVWVTGRSGYHEQRRGPQEQALSEAECLRLAELITQVFELWEGPVDVEFIWRAGDASPTLLQVRSAIAMYG